MPRPARPMPSSAMLAGSGTGVPPSPGGVVTPAGGAARVKAEATEKLLREPLRFKLAITLAGEGSKAVRLPDGMNVPRNSAVIDSLPLGATNSAVFWAELATNVPPENDARKSLGLAVLVGAVPPGRVNVPIVTGKPAATVEKLLVPPCVVAFVTLKLVRVSSDCPVSSAPSAKLSEPVIGAALAALAQTTAVAANAILARWFMVRFRS